MISEGESVAKYFLIWKSRNVMGPSIEDREKKERKKVPWKVKKKAYNGDIWLRFQACMLIGKCRKQRVDRKWSCMVDSPSFGVRHVTLAKCAIPGNPSDAQSYSFLNSTFRNNDDLCMTWSCEDNRKCVYQNIRSSLGHGLQKHWLRESASCFSS